jgi:hypothetical protein
MAETIGFEPWTGIGDRYAAGAVKLLVVGDYRFDELFSDRQIILGKQRGQWHPTFTNFHQSVLGQRRWEEGYEEAVRDFWERTLFYNYNVQSPRDPAAALPVDLRRDPRNAVQLRTMLATYHPTHAIVWGFDNWRFLAVEGAAWEEESYLRCGENDEPYRAVVVEGRRTLFTRVKHPAAGFVYERWAQLLLEFLALRP